MPDIWILVVDSNGDDAALLTTALRWNDRPEVARHCFTGAAAIELLEASIDPPKLVVLDGRLPGMSGLELLDYLRSRPQTRSVPVVFFSDDVREEVVSGALQKGANSYICKDTEFNETMQGLRDMLHYWLDVHCHPTT